MGILYVVGTPIGNLEDITYRAVRILHEVDVIVCEDTRVTKKLLNRYQINKPLISYHQHSKMLKIVEIVEMLKSNKNVAFVTDAGTPGINDPGGILIQKILQGCHSEPHWGEESQFQKRDPSTSLRFAQDDDYIKVVPIPGASALTTLLSVSGIPADKFLFLGFLPKKKGRQTLLKTINKQLTTFNIPIIIYESPYRVVKTLEDFAKISDFNVIIGRELTKKFEEIIRGKIKNVIADFRSNKYKLKGEFTIILKNVKAQMSNIK